MDKVKVGIIGTGFSAMSHLEGLRRVSHIEVVAIASGSKEKAQQKAAEFAIPKAYGDAYELIHDPEVEVIHNCTPNHLHYSINREVLLAGKHLLSEKPLAMNSAESRELSELAKKSQSVSGVCFNYRHYPLVAQAKGAIANNEYGRVHLVYGGYIQDWLLYDTDYNWRLDPERNGTSRAIADIGSHWCDTVQYVLGRKIVEVFADLKTVHPVRLKPKDQVSTFTSSQNEGREEIKITTEDYGSVLVHFEDGIHGVFTVSQVSAGRKNKLHFEIAAEKASLAWDQEKPNQLWIGKRDEPNGELLRDPSLLSSYAASLAHYPGGHEEGWPDGLKNLFIDFYGSVKRSKKGIKNENPSSFASIEDGHRIMRLIEAILESHRTKKWVRLSNE
jgi:predicted dehydrogenase